MKKKPALKKNKTALKKASSKAKRTARQRKEQTTHSASPKRGPGFKFTRDWFSWAPPLWTQLFQQLDRKRSFLEIGSFEGRSTVWLVENALEDGGEIICVDTWEGGEEHTLALAKNAHKLFKWNTSILAKKHPKKIINQVISTSTDALSKLQNKNNQGRFDFIYIDGSHVAKDVLTDACLAWPLLRRGGALVFDDYGWAIDLPETHKPKMAVNAFIRVFKEELAVIHKGYQVVVQKMR